MAKEYSYGICLYRITNNGVFILLNKTSNISKFNFFKGKIEINEDIKQCAIREFKEETNIDIPINYLEEYFIQNSKRKNIGLFLVDANGFDKLCFKFNRDEIFSTEWINLKCNITISKNQSKILCDIQNYFIYKQNNIKLINFTLS